MLGIKKSEKTPLTVADSWAKITIENWQKKLHKFRIGYSLDLENSFSKEIISSPQGELIKISFEFKYYGKFVDMGVGKGTKLGDVKENRTSRRLEGRILGNRRRPKKWYSKTFHAETARLAEIMAEEFAHAGVLNIVENIDDNSKR